MSREPCISIGFSWTEKNGRIPAGPIWTVNWLPKGYGPTKDERLLAVFLDTEGKWNGHGLRMPEDCDDEKPSPLPRLLQVIKVALETHLREHPEDLAGHLVNLDSRDSVREEVTN